MAQKAISDYQIAATTHRQGLKAVDLSDQLTVELTESVIRESINKGQHVKARVRIAQAEYHGCLSVRTCNKLLDTLLLAVLLERVAARR